MLEFDDHARIGPYDQPRSPQTTPVWHSQDQSGVSMKSKKPACAPVVVVGFTVSFMAFPLLASPPMTPTNIDVSQLPNNESEETIAVNPTNPNNIVIVTNVVVPAAGMFAAVSLDGGSSWATRIIGNNDNLGAACCDPSLSFDEFGNLFLTYLFNVGNTVPVALSTDGGLSFNSIANIAKPAGSGTQTSSERRGLFRFVDQPTIAAGKGEVWVVFNGGGPIVAAGAPVTGLGEVGGFIAPEVVAGTNNCTYGDLAIGPNGQVMQVCTLTESGQGGGKIYVNVDPDGLGPAGFNDHSIFVVDTHVGGFNFIPAQPDRSVDAEPGLAWDRTGGPHNGRVYLVYSRELKNNSDNLAVSWYDARNDLGAGGAGGTDGIPNDDAQVWGAFSTDGGQTFSRNIQISAGTSNSHDAHNGIDYGDYSGLSFYGGIAHPAWSDNSNSTGNNPDGTLHQLDIYSASVPVRGR